MLWTPWRRGFMLGRIAWATPPADLAKRRRAAPDGDGWRLPDADDRGATGAGAPLAVQSLLAPKTEIPGGLHVGLSVLAGVLVIGLWCWLTYGGHVRPDFLAAPHEVLLAGWRGLTRGSLLGHIWSSVVVIFSDFLLA